MARPRLAVHWTSGCGGCEAVFLDLGEELMVLDRRFEVVYFPLLLDAKLNHLVELPDGAIDICLITGAIRTTEDVEMVRLLRRVSSTVVAFGACAHLGSVLGLANLVSSSQLLQTVFGANSDWVETGSRSVPGRGVDLELPTLPPLTSALLDVGGVVPVDFSVPGCPPESRRLAEVLQLFSSACGDRGLLPPRGSVIGALDVAVCEECQLEVPQGPVAVFVRQHQVQPDGLRCLLDQGLVCSGPATRGGCGALCPAAGIGCRGCYGPMASVVDPGTRMAAALVAMAPTDDPVLHEARLEEDADRLAASIVDPIGSLYRYCFATSLLGRLADVVGDS